MFVNTHVGWQEVRHRNRRQLFRWGGVFLVGLIIFLMSLSVYSVPLCNRRLLLPPTPTAAPGPLIEFFVLPFGDGAP